MFLIREPGGNLAPGGPKATNHKRDYSLSMSGSESARKHIRALFLPNHLLPYHHPILTLPGRAYSSPPAAQIKSILSSYYDFPQGYCLHIIFTLASYFLLISGDAVSSCMTETESSEETRLLQKSNQKISRAR